MSFTRTYWGVIRAFSISRSLILACEEEICCLRDQRRKGWWMVQRYVHLPLFIKLLGRKVHQKLTRNPVRGWKVRIASIRFASPPRFPLSLPNQQQWMFEVWGWFYDSSSTTGAIYSNVTVVRGGRYLPRPLLNAFLFAWKPEKLSLSSIRSFKLLELIGGFQSRRNSPFVPW